MCEMLEEIIEIFSSFAFFFPLFFNPLLQISPLCCQTSRGLPRKPQCLLAPGLQPGEEGSKCVPNWLVTGNALFHQEFLCRQSLSSLEMRDGGWEQQMLLETLQALAGALAVLRGFPFLVSCGGILGVQGSTPGSSEALCGVELLLGS